MKVRVESAPSPGDHKGSPLLCYGFASGGMHGPHHRATTRDRPYYATASQAGACMVAKERFFPFTRKFYAMCHSKQSPLKGRYFVKRAGKMGGDHWIALCPVPLPLRTYLAPAPHGRRKRPHSTPLHSRPYK